jgi:hypothetical protein
MKDEGKAREQLISELAKSHQRIGQMEALENRGKRKVVVGAARVKW